MYIHLIGRDESAWRRAAIAAAELRYVPACACVCGASTRAARPRESPSQDDDDDDNITPRPRDERDARCGNALLKKSRGAPMW